MAAAISSSSGRYGTSATILLKTLSRLARSASDSLDSVATSSIFSVRATRYGSSLTYSLTRTRCRPCTRMRMVPSGSLIILCARPTVPTGYSRSGPGVSTSASRLVTMASRRSPASTSSMSLMLRSCPMVSGIIVSGNTTVSRRGRTGRTAGIS